MKSWLGYRACRVCLAKPNEPCRYTGGTHLMKGDGRILKHPHPGRWKHWTATARSRDGY